MKAIIIITAAMLATSAHAIDYEKFCERHGKMAETTMRTRQAGVPLSEVLKLVESPVYKRMIIAAYKEPRMHTEDFQKRATDDFRIAQEVSCHEMAEEHKARKAAE